MDIEYLLFLQKLRLSAGNFFESFFCLLTDSALVVMLIPLIVFYLFDKKKGIFVLFTYNIAQTLNSLIKLTACVYRPWIRDSRVILAEKARKHATGYSFPSGHTAASSSVSFGMIHEYKQKKWLVALFLIYALLVAFSRNFLCCHTPQDVLVALCESILSLFLVSLIKKFIEKNEKNALKVFVSGLSLLTAIMIFVLVKNYPQDFDSSGNLLVSPAEMQASSMQDFGFAFGFLLGWFLERTFVKFSTENLNWKKIALRLGLLFAFVALILLVVKPVMKANCDLRIVNFTYTFLLFFGTLFVIPVIFTKIEKKF